MQAFELIDTLWNVNLAGGCEYLAMEVELIDTLWNVNALLYSQRHPSNIELIDTLWNVNKNTMELKEIESIELIDTLWNVNLTIVPSFGDSAGRINRYIMECKSERLRNAFGYIFELIDTLWNVNPPPGKKLKHVCQN